MKKLTALLASTALLVPGAVLASGCGAEEAAGVDVASAAQATAEKGTARMTMSMKLDGLGLPAPMTMDASGVTDLDEPKAAITMDFGALLKAAGAPSSGDAKVELRIDGKDLYVKPPAIPGLEIPGGKAWVALDVAKAAEAMGLDTKGLGELMTIDPSAQLRAIKAAKGMEEVGEETIDGARTTHFKGTLKMSDYIASLPEDRKAAAESALKELDKLGGEGSSAASFDDPIPTEIWVDEDGVARRMKMDSKIPSQQGTPAGRMTITYSLSDFGARLDAGAPPASDTWDATDALSGALKQGMSAMGTTPTPG